MCFTTISNEDTEYSTVLDNRELVQVKYYLKLNMNKLMNIQKPHEITNYLEHNKNGDVTNARLNLNSS